ncbi:hypothetical protein LCGC14_0741870 [marine sediment metagenome]|uniref:Uncharacterized protein n=1 Tax=marine sediment metagenome TaxID=412755 RepID=A0A0F9TDQ0_9ZZZZ
MNIMKYKNHFLITTLFFILLWLIIPEVQITEIIFPSILSTFPDIDRQFKVLGHRSALTHSIIIPFIVYLFNPYMNYLLIMLSVAMHGLCDIRLQPKKQVGYYTIKWFGMKSTGRYTYKNLNGGYSTLWLSINFWIAFIQFIIIVVIF